MSIAQAMQFEDIKPRSLPKGTIKKLRTESDINKMSSSAIVWKLLVRHYKVLAFIGSFSLNVLYVAKHFGFLFN